MLRWKQESLKEQSSMLKGSIDMLITLKPWLESQVIE